MTPRPDHDHAPPTDPSLPAAWDQRYAESDRIWSGEPNLALVAEAAGLSPGRRSTWAAARARTPCGSPCAAGTDEQRPRSVDRGAGAHHRHDLVLRGTRLR